ncbi:type II toxin-antitoxin system mRNA interferase toxin, RelE/StbE family [Candidatus Nomurabacteria bacterium]|nr:type II toxin-antitoxin system mRNA interferase toxin, RelE/StbE family [Candidatus Nomurabacteria bacterium]
MLIVANKKFDKKVSKQSLEVQKELKNRIRIFAYNKNHPILKTHKLSGKLKGLWSFSVSGDIRVIFDQSQKGVIILVDIGSHSELYG